MNNRLSYPNPVLNSQELDCLESLEKRNKKLTEPNSLKKGRSPRFRPSGSGKSTCARLAARLWDIQEGSIKVGGVDAGSVDPEVLLTDYSMVF